MTTVRGLKWLTAENWFPTKAELQSDEIYIYPRSIYCHGIMPSEAKIIFVRAKDKMVFFFDWKT